MEGINVIFQIIILVFSVMIHEISHGAMALAFGDKTAEYEGRLTLNPLKHIDLFGSIILPFLLFITGTGFIIGWAKPVPYNPYNLKNAKIAEPLIAFAGAFSNILIAVIFGTIIRVMIFYNFYNPTILIFGYIVIINISLAVFNLIPIPPLDGSKILFSILPSKNRFAFIGAMEKYGLIILLAVILFLPNIISPIILWLYKLITG